MKMRLFLSSIAIQWTLLVSPLQAVTLIPLHTTPLHSLHQSFQLITPGMTLIRSLGENTLVFVKEHTDFKNITHVRMQQQYQGFLVFGGYVILHSKYKANALSSDRLGVTMDGTLVQGLKDELGQPPAALLANAKSVLEGFKTPYHAFRVSKEQVIPIVYIKKDHQAVWAYKVSLMVSPAAGMPRKPAAIIDAATGQVLLQWNDIKTVTAAMKGKGFGGNMRTGQYEYGVDLPLLNIFRDHSSETCSMENEHVRVVDMHDRWEGPDAPIYFHCGHGMESSGSVFWTGYKEDGYELENGAYSPANDALYSGEIVHNMYKDWFGFNALSTSDGEPLQLIMVIHFGDGFENAFWDGERMIFGDGAEEFFPLVSLGVAAHEISHGFTEHHSNLVYVDQSGGMNESFSDMAAQAAEFYSRGHSSWEIGSDVKKEGTLRYMDRPSRDGESIDSADQYEEGMDPHYSSGVYNRLFYLLSNHAGWDVKKTFELMVKANMDYWTPYSTFDEGGCGVIHAAADLLFPVDDVKEALSFVAINTSTCVIHLPG